MGRTSRCGPLRSALVSLVLRRPRCQVAVQAKLDEAPDRIGFLWNAFAFLKCSHLVAEIAKANGDLAADLGSASSCHPGCSLSCPGLMRVLIVPLRALQALRADWPDRPVDRPGVAVEPCELDASTRSRVPGGGKGDPSQAEGPSARSHGVSSATQPAHRCAGAALPCWRAR